MSGSVAEERIRGRVEALLRARFPDARIIHELVLDQGGVRIDLAAVTPDRLAVAEIKSERDVLKRLRTQVEVGLGVAQEVWVFVAERHEAALQHMGERLIWTPLQGPPGLPDQGGWMNPAPMGSTPNADHLAGLRDCYLRVERASGAFEPPAGGMWAPWRPERTLNPAAGLRMLWREELVWLTGGFGAGPRATREDMIAMAVEHMSGGAVRRGICACLRRRRFPRADMAVAA